MEGKFIGSRQAKIFHKSNRIYGLPQREVPGWLRDLAEAPDSYLNKKAPMEKILCDSLFYPGCGVDGRIVKYMSGYIHSFIYVDYTHSRSFILDRFFGSRTMENKHAGVTGYHCILEKDISRGEIAVAGWNPPCPPESTSRFPYPAHSWAKYFGHWTVWQRDSDRDGGRGPELFSFIYISGEACAIYETLYNRLNIAPLVIAFVQVGGLDGGWTSLTAQGAHFHSALNNNRDGIPLFQIYASTGNGFGALSKPCFQEYRDSPVCHQLGLFPIREEILPVARKETLIEEIRQWNEANSQHEA